MSSRRIPVASMLLTALVNAMPKVWSTPLGFPVVPAVYSRYQMSSWFRQGMTTLAPDAPARLAA